jgi:hypothetical protein
MGLKLFADHCVPFSIIQSLREAGIEVLVLKDHIPPDSPVPPFFQGRLSAFNSRIR